MNSQPVIYAAGNPDLYPLEYYDKETEDFQGAIPDLLRQFAQDNGYELRYYQSGTEDRREELAENRQVDLISGCVDGEHYSHTAGQALTLFSAETDSGTEVYQIFLTDVSPQNFQQQLSTFISERTPAEWTGAILETSETQQTTDGLMPAVIGLGVSLCVLAAVLLLLIRHFRRKLRQTEKLQQTDPETGVWTVDYFEKVLFPRTVNDKNRSLYYIIYFQFDLGHIERLGGQEEPLVFRRYAAEVLHKRMENTDVLAAMPGGALTGLKMAQDAKAVQEWTLGALEELRLFQNAGGILRPGDIAVGIYPLAATDYNLRTLLYHARQCALAARRDGIDYNVCGTERCLACQEERQLLNEIDRGLEQGEFQLYLQFLVDANTFRIVGAEAMSRWQHPQKGLLPPARFIPALEQEGRLDRLDYFSLDKACAFLEEIEQNQVNDFFISCNFSRQTFSSIDFVEQCSSVMNQYQFTRNLLIMEVTESKDLNAAEQAQMLRNITSMRALGARVIFDDFGMGVSSFHDLNEYPMDGLKLDKCLVDNMWTSRGRIILNALVRTGHELGLTIFVEGIETEQQMKVFQELKCDIFQGFLFSVPLPEAYAKKRVLRGERQQ